MDVNTASFTVKVAPSIATSFFTYELVSVFKPRLSFCSLTLSSGQGPLDPTLTNMLDSAIVSCLSSRFIFRIPI